MKKNIVITGSNGLIGSSLREISLKYNDKYNFIFACRENFGDLTIKENVINLYEQTNCNYLISAAAKVSGIGGNVAEPVEHFKENVLMNIYLLDYAHKYNVEKVLAFSSVCVFPNDLEYLQEHKMHDGPIYHANASYGYSKRCIDVFIQALKNQYNVKNYSSIIPGNIFGINDRYNIENSHVLLSLIHKLYLAKKHDTNFEIWGNGESFREFIFSDDVALVLMRLLDEVEDIPDKLLLSGDEEYSIRQMVEFLCEAADFTGNVHYDSNKPGGQTRRKSDSSKLKGLFPDFQRSDIRKSVILSYQWFERNYPNVRL